MGLRMLAFTRLTFARQFLLLSFLILLIGMLVIGFWVSRQIHTGVLNRTAAVTALYVDSFIAPYAQELAHADRLGAERVAALDTLLTGTPLGQRIVAFKVWAPDGYVLYSSNPELIGRRYPVGSKLAAAFAGEVRTEISDLSAPENEYERKRWSRLIETYAPIRTEGSRAILAVSEFYQTTDDLDREVLGAQLRSAIVVGTATLVMYLLLAGLVGRASNTIMAQQRDLREKVTRLTALLVQNRQLHERVSRAAARATALNERFLQRISADLHDGPGQDLSLALLRIESLSAASAGEGRAAPAQSGGQDSRTIKAALESALSELRAISAGLRLPEIGDLTPAATVERAVKDYQRKTGQEVAWEVANLPEEAPLPVKIALYRLLQESLANGYRHAAGAGQRVRVAGGDGQITAEVTDIGPGFDPQAAIEDGHLGLAGLRERVEILGGTFEVRSTPGRGTVIRARLPLAAPEVPGE